MALPNPATKGIVMPSGHLLTVSQQPQECLSYTPGNSYMVSFGINTATGANGASTRPGDNSASNDAYLLSKALVDSKAVPEENVFVLTNRDEHNACTREAMRSAFRKQAEKVGPQGLFVCTYCGPAMKVAEGEWSFPPFEFVMENSLTHITAASLTQWLSGTPVKKALFVLDCSFADDIATQLTTLENYEAANDGYVIERYVLSTSTSGVACAIQTLGHSFFSYFTARAFRSSTTSGFLTPSKLHESIRKPCTALSSLLVTYNSIKEELAPKVVNPKLKSLVVSRVELILPPVQEDDETDGDVGRFEFLTKLYDRSKPSVKIQDKVYAWLETIREYPEGPLAQLQEQEILSKEVLLTAVCSMVFSVASIQVALDKQSISNPNCLIVVFMTVIATLEIHTEVDVTVELFKCAWKLYHQVVEDNGVRDRGVTELFRKVVMGDSRVAVQTN